MKKNMKKINFLIIFIFFLTSCGTFDKAGKVLRNEKIRSNDEFLVQKKDPLVLPPDYNKIPAPGTINQQKTNKNENKIKSILNVTKETIPKSKSKTAEQSILDKIKK
mgnify:CR=1 FL=1